MQVECDLYELYVVSSQHFFIIFFIFFTTQQSLQNKDKKRFSRGEKKKDSLLHLRESYDVSISNGPIHNGSFSFSFHSLFYSLAVSEGFQLTPPPDPGNRDTRYATPLRRLTDDG